MAGSASNIQKSTWPKAGLLNMWVAIRSLSSMPRAVDGMTNVAIHSRPLLSFCWAKASLPCALRKRRITLSRPRRKNTESTASIEKPSRKRPASSFCMLRVTSAVNPNAIKAALSFAPAAKESFIRVAARPVARV